MAVATTQEYWTARVRGTDPNASDLADTSNKNTQWSVSGGGTGAVDGDYWKISGSGGKIYTTAPSSDYTSYTILTCLKMTTAADNNGVLLKLDNGTHSVQVQSTGNTNTVKLVGTTTVTSGDLDFDMGDDEAVPVMLRLTLNATTNKARLYMHEIIEDDDATTHYLEVTATNDSSGSRSIQWGNATGNISWASTYATYHGAFDPEELMLSDFATDSLSRMGIAIVNRLKDSDRPYLKTHVSDANIVYGYDISSKMISRLGTPAIHVLVTEISSPTFASLGGGKVEQEYEVTVFNTTRGTNYKNAYRHCLNIAGEVFDEIYRNTGLNGTTDSLINYSAKFDHKVDNDETICIHQLKFTYRRRIDMRHR